MTTDRSILGRLAADLHPEPSWMLDTDLQFVWLNLAAQEWLGRSERSLAGKSLVVLGPILGELPDLVRRAIQEERTVVARSQTVNDSLVDIYLRWLSHEDLVLVSILPATSLDATSDQAPALGFGRMLAHELKNPLASIRGAAQLIRVGDKDGANAEMADLIINDADRIARLADHWSGIGDVELKTTQSLNLNRIAMTAIDHVRRAKPGCEVVIKDALDPSLPRCTGDADMLVQLVINLLQNAIDASEGVDAPQVTVSTRYSGVKRGKRANRPVPLSINIEDCGHGIPAQLQANIFTPFVTSKPAGEGLGLAFCARIAELHFGMLDFETRPGRTVFSLHLPQEKQ